MVRKFVISLVTVFVCMTLSATDFKTFETKTFSVGYPSNWEVTYYGDEWMNMEDPEGEIRFSATFNEEGPKLNQLKEAVDNWVYMKESHGHKVDQKLVKDDYALVRTIETDEEDGTQTVEVWYLMITNEPKGFSGTITCPIERANEAIDVLVEVLATLKQK